jgi:hypothetical protein
MLRLCSDRHYAGDILGIGALFDGANHAIRRTFDCLTRGRLVGTVGSSIWGRGIDAVERLGSSEMSPAADVNRIDRRLVTTYATQSWTTIAGVRE